MEESDYTNHLQMPFLLPGIRIYLIIDRSLSLGTYNTYVLDIVTFTYNTYQHVCIHIHMGSSLSEPTLNCTLRMHFDSTTEVHTYTCFMSKVVIQIKQ